MQPQQSFTTFDCWLWIELIGFDNAQNDFGVGAFLENVGCLPKAISLLLFNADFIHLHNGMAEERRLPYDCCSYGGHPRNQERERQDWSNHQLKGLIQELQKRDIAVYFAVFDMFVTQEWIGQHPEILHVRKDGLRLHSVCPWKRLSDGTFYEDFFVEQLVRVMRDYRFDGHHGADGYSHPRIPVYDGDFSDDMVGQFQQASEVSLPPEHGTECDDNPERLRQRADWIWSNHRREWIEFYTDRTTRFWKKVVEALHAEGKKVVLNSAWTRDPFEAKYRYGMDYRRLVEAGVDGFIVEAAAAASETEREESSAKVLLDFTAMLLLIKACVPETPLYFLHGVKDTREQWNVLHHAPTSLEREVHSLSNVYMNDANGRLRRCASGLVVCLADDIRQHEWQWLREIWELAFDGQPQRVVGATVVWSDAALDNQMEDFITTRRWTTHKLLHNLIAHGAPVCSAVNVNDLASVSGPILALNPHLFPDEELQSLIAYTQGPVAMIGVRPDLLPEPAFQLEDATSPGAPWCGVYGENVSVAVPVANGSNMEMPVDLMDLTDPPSFLNDLYCRQASDTFLKICADLIHTCSQGVKVLRPVDGVNMMAYEMETGRLRLFVGNDRHGYVVTQLDVGAKIESIRVLTPYPVFPVEPDGSNFTFKLPGRGMVVMELEMMVT